jgi:Brp/Blh family beta-carotene 15,15'-monooxygenase
MHIRLLLLLPGLLCWILQALGWIPPVYLQVGLFIGGMLLLGVPHGAADLLVANSISNMQGRKFRHASFILSYLGRILLFALILWAFPWIGLAIFLIISAFHFGETDFSQHEMSDAWSRLFVVTYGLSVLAILLLSHLGEVAPLLSFLAEPERVEQLVTLISSVRPHIFLGLGCCLIITGFRVHLRRPGFFHGWIRSEAMYIPAILIFLWQLPLLLGFTFYFIGWHSVLSMSSILKYLVKVNGLSVSNVWRQMFFYSGLAILGTLVIGASGFMFSDINAMIWYSLMSLAVLTGPHMVVMHDMYTLLRRK